MCGPKRRGRVTGLQVGSMGGHWLGWGWLGPLSRAHWPGRDCSGLCLQMSLPCASVASCSSLLDPRVPLHWAPSRELSPHNLMSMLVLHSLDLGVEAKTGCSLFSLRAHPASPVSSPLLCLGPVGTVGPKGLSGLFTCSGCGCGSTKTVPQSHCSPGCGQLCHCSPTAHTSLLLLTTALGMGNHHTLPWLFCSTSLGW